MALEFFKRKDGKVFIKVADESVFVTFKDTEIKAYKRDNYESISEILKYLEFEESEFEQATDREYEQGQESVLALLPF